jgi:cytochrome c-type biogenesis protein CcmH/NrfG
MENTPAGSDQAKAVWRPLQAYLLAAVCLVVGLPVGYLLRGSAPQVAPTPAPVANVADAATPGTPPHAMPSLEDMKRMADKKAEPLLAKLKSDPNNADLLNQVGILYKSTHQFKEAEDYFQKSLNSDPKNVNVRTDLASCLYYTGDVDGALAQLQKSLSYDPKHAGALLNMGIIRWQGKNDVDGAVASWETLLKLNPNFPQKDVVEKLIAQAQQQKNAVKAANAPPR